MTTCLCCEFENFAKSRRFPLTAFGDVNTYAIFSEVAKDLVSDFGRAGLIVPTSIGTDSTTSKFFQEIVRTKRLHSITGFENERFLFSGIDHRVLFCLTVLGGNQSSFEQIIFSWLAWDLKQANDLRRTVILEESDFGLINPNSFTCPVFRTRDDSKLTRKIYQSSPVIENEATGKNSWEISLMTMFHMSSDSNLFMDECLGNNSLPLYEAKMFYHFYHRHSTYKDASQANLNVGILPQPSDEEKSNPTYFNKPRYWVDRSAVDQRLDGKWNKKWLLSFRDIARANNERTAIFSILPRVAVGNNAPLVLVTVNNLHLMACLFGNFCSLIFDFVARQKVGGTHLNFFIFKQLPVLSPNRYSRADVDFISPCVLELTYTAWDLQPFAQDMGHDDEPFVWNPERRAHLRAELDAYYAHLYGLTRDELRYILDPADVYGPDFPSETFRVLKNNEMRQFGEYRTQCLVLEAWDKLFGKH